jgi:hypothetical protein
MDTLECLKKTKLDIPLIIVSAALVKLKPLPP